MLKSPANDQHLAWGNLWHFSKRPFLGSFFFLVCLVFFLKHLRYYQSTSFWKEDTLGLDGFFKRAICGYKLTRIYHTLGTLSPRLPPPLTAELGPQGGGSTSVPEAKQKHSHGCRKHMCVTGGGGNLGLRTRYYTWLTPVRTRWVAQGLDSVLCNDLYGERI